MPPTCKSCRYFVIDERPGKDEWGLCKRYPPGYAREPSLTWMWPRVRANECCGEHDRGPKAMPMSEAEVSPAKKGK